VIAIVLSALVAAACVFASALRLGRAVSPTSLHPRLLADAVAARPAALEGLGGALARAAETDERLQWERDLWAAIAAPAGVREAAIGEQLTELDGSVHRWARVPAVCARVATSSSFLLASILLVRALAVEAGIEPESAVRSALVSAVDSLAIGIAGASFCVAVHVRARRVLRDRLAAIDQLVTRLRAAADHAGSAANPGQAAETALQPT
jgi:hypothetical protein